MLNLSFPNLCFCIKLKTLINPNELLQVSSLPVNPFTVNIIPKLQSKLFNSP